ncbi:MAG: hypothetical protein K2M80_02655, partial [Muribaculaceae bacterium]|nr:hypothetical protein [Muribaculaceae bacterium]
LQLGVPYSLTVGGSSGDIPVAENIENPHLVFIPAAKILTITGQSVEAETIYGIHGECFGSDWETKDMTEADGKWSLTAEVIPGGFGIKVMDKASGAQTGWISSAADGVVAYGSPMPCVVGGTNWTLNADGACEFIFDPEAMTLTVNAANPPAAEIVFYFDNSASNWDEVTAIFTNEAGDEDEYLMEETSVAGILEAYATDAYTKVKFTDGGSNETAEYDLKDSYLYSTTNSGEPYELPVDYSSMYVTLFGTFNGWADSGIHPADDGIATFSNVAIGTGEFKIKTWDGTDAYFSTGGAVAQDEWVKIYGNRDANMTVEGATADSRFDVQFNVKTSSIFITVAAPVDYTKYYVTVIGDFNNWTAEGTQANAEGIAEVKVSDVNTSFKFKVYNGTADTYYANDGELPLNTLVALSGNSDTMVLPADAQEGEVTFIYNCETNEVKAIHDSGVEAISIDADNAAPVYYNLQGVKVSEPAAGLYIVRRGDKVAKEIIR